MYISYLQLKNIIFLNVLNNQCTNYLINLNVKFQKILKIEKFIIKIKNLSKI